MPQEVFINIISSEYSPRFYLLLNLYQLGTFLLVGWLHTIESFLFNFGLIKHDFLNLTFGAYSYHVAHLF